VEVTILIERIWWALGTERTDPGTWEDRPFSLCPIDFRATSDKGFWVRLPRLRWTSELSVGFDRAKARAYTVRVSKQTVFIPLRDFESSKEVKQSQGSVLKVWIERDGKQQETSIASIKPVQPTGYRTGFGRKKSVVAKAVIRQGHFDIVVNGQHIWDYFKATPPDARRFLERFLKLDLVSEALRDIEVHITVCGSSPQRPRQARAVTYAVARALMANNSKLKPLLKRAGFAGASITRVPDLLRER
jgi:ribosomal protein S9